MRIKLTWVSREPLAQNVLLYRSTQPFSVSDIAQMTPIATLPGGSTEYVDEDVIFEQTYYYRTRVIKSGQSATSEQFSAQAVPRNGPGPQQLISGDHEGGFYGLMSVTDGSLPSILEINNQLLKQNSISYPFFNSLNPSSNARWGKFVFKGKTLYVPGSSANDLVSGNNWKTLYEKGLVYGTDDFGPTDVFLRQSGRTVDTNQLRTITYRGDTFIVRMMRCTPFSSYEINNTYYTNYYNDSIYNKDSEYDMTIGRVESVVNRWTHPNKLANLNSFFINKHRNSATTISPTFFAETRQQTLVYRGWIYSYDYNVEGARDKINSNAVSYNYVNSATSGSIQLAEHRGMVILEWVPNYLI